MAVFLDEDDHEDDAWDVGVLGAQEVLDGLVEDTANPATPGMAVPYGTETCSSGQVTVPFA